MSDLFVGTWTLNPERCEFDPNHRPTSGRLVFERDGRGHYLMRAEGTSAKGEKVAERPQTLIPDGEPHPVPDFPGLSSRVTQLNPNELCAEVKREDGSVVGGGTYVVSSDGKSMTATAAGFDTQLRRFETRTVWERAV